MRPDFAEALIDRGNLLQSLRRFDAALASYDRALKEQPNHAGIWNNRGSALHAIGRLEEAGAAFDAALRLDPLSSQAWCNRGNLLLTLQQADAALASYDKALAIQPNCIIWARGRAEAPLPLRRSSRQFRRGLGVRAHVRPCEKQ